MEKRILVIDDEQKIRSILTRLLGDAGYQVRSAENGKTGMEAVLDFAPDLVFLDLKMPGIGGLEILKELIADGYAGKVIILTAHGSIASAVEAMRIGAHDYITKPFDVDELLIIVERALKHSQLEKDFEAVKQQLDRQYSLGGIITNNPKMKTLLETVRRIGPSDTSVLISGASGTGKELFARAVHQQSRRRNRKFVALNCGALPENLIESELFGYRKGAFSGANSSKPGLVEEANGGTLFLDEIGEMGLGAQVKMLRFAQSGEFIALGDTAIRNVNVRLIAASNQDLKSAIAESRFREDLYYRLNVVSLHIPPLNERREDIPLLVHHFLKQFGKEPGKGKFTFGADALEILQLYDWPGNVRELENAVHSALVMAQRSPISIDDLPVTLKESLPESRLPKGGGSLPEIVSSYQEVIERKTIVDALKNCGGNQTKAAVFLGIGRTTLVRKIKQYGIS